MGVRNVSMMLILSLYQESRVECIQVVGTWKWRKIPTLIVAREQFGDRECSANSDVGGPHPNGLWLAIWGSHRKSGLPTVTIVTAELLVRAIQDHNCGSN